MEIELLGHHTVLGRGIESAEARPRVDGEGVARFVPARRREFAVPLQLDLVSFLAAGRDVDGTHAADANKLSVVASAFMLGKLKAPIRCNTRQ